MTRRLLVLVLGSLAFGVLVAALARSVWGDSAVVYSATALALCLIPGIAAVAAATWSSDQSDKQLIMVLGSTGVRLAVVLAGGMALLHWVPYFREFETPGFWVYVGTFYLFTLALETGLTLGGRPQTDRVPARVCAAGRTGGLEDSHGT